MTPHGAGKVTAIVMPLPTAARHLHGLDRVACQLVHLISAMEPRADLMSEPRTLMAPAEIEESQVHCVHGYAGPPESTAAPVQRARLRTRTHVRATAVSGNTRQSIPTPPGRERVRACEMRLAWG
jgi:hypothetical protein